MLAPRIKYNLSRILPFGIIWLLLAFVFLFIEYAAAPDTVGEGAIKVNLRVLLFACSAIFVLGLIIGTIELYVINPLFAKNSFAKKMLGKLAIYILLLFVILLFTFPVAASLELGVSVFSEAVWTKFAVFLKSLTFWSTALQLGVSLGISLFYVEMSENMGHGVLRNLLTGKYHKPQEETRIFMFLDMKSSTTIAEQLGHVRYFDLLNAYYRDLSGAIIEFSGEIYQYVGDEIVVSWPLKKGLQNNNCLACFTQMKTAMQQRADWYKTQFGVAPTFKAGFHMGKVTTGEIGSLKKDIIFTGDVLNTTARIQALCNSFGVDVLISKVLVEALKLDGTYTLTPLGETELRGKMEALELYAVTWFS
ncbi:adenylate/guanylate cyclase domain-containing protein [Tamlana crocina]|uniref:Adenylate/guanylate cyclase domain-containing protein n=1 Tax=Tamlana crocina TaxID=393006 RepID=A0ABX1DEM4_9FLAO|nr:adenylate/guanylate cyclase domain-containing protein [Tamlana crocina]NJX15509.1 adenylate/guanylate cyclase domain-containing protein [Tamlana crocina]